MPAVGHPSLDQLNTFAAVAEAGSFSAAARRLGRAQSVISYAIAQLEAQLGLPLFDRAGRVPVLTEAGRALLGDARRAGTAVDDLRARAAGLQAGLEAAVALGIDVMFPNAALVAVLEAFASAFPTVALRLCIEALGGVPALVAAGQCGLGVGTELPDLPARLRLRPIGSVRLIPVAAPSHPLATAASPEAVRDATQIVLADRSELTAGRDVAVLSLRSWRIGDLGAKHALLRAGLGWGNMPEALVRDDLAARRLVRLTLEEAREHDYPLALMERRDQPLGPAGRWLAERLEAALSAAARDVSPGRGTAAGCRPPGDAPAG